MTREYKINIQGYYKDDSRSFFPASPIIYFVYRGKYDVECHTCTLKELLYIGDSKNAYETLNDNRLNTLFSERLAEHESLFYAVSFTDLAEDKRRMIVQALIYELKPSLNTDIFPKPSSVTIIIEGNSHAFVPARIEAPSF